MQRLISRCQLTVFAGIIFGFSHWIPAPSQQLGATEKVKVNDAGAASFSGTKFSRRVKLLPDGREHFVQNEIYPFKLARDSNGRVRLQAIDLFPECDKLNLRRPPPCPVWNEIVFNPDAQTITHWPEGEMAGRAAVVVQLSSSQVGEVEKAVNAQIPEYTPPYEPDATSVETENLGDRLIEGVHATGTRTTAVFPPGHAGNKLAMTLIHEDWRSKELNILVRIVDGPLGSELVISGFEKITVNPNESMFRPPETYAVQHRESGQFAEQDIQLLIDTFTP